MNNPQKKLIGLPLYLIMLGMLIAGTANTVLTKWQNCLKGIPGIDYKGDPMTFTHPYV